MRNNICSTAVLAGITLLMLLGSGRSHGATNDIAALLQPFLSAQTNLQTWSADLTQTRKLKTLTQPLMSTGHVWFASPNLFRWKIESPVPTIAVRSADEMVVIYPRLKRAEKYPLSGQQNGPWKDMLSLLEAGFPRSQADLDRQFKILSAETTNGTVSLALQPKSASARKMMPRITIAFGTNDFSLRSTELEFGDGSVMRNDFRNPEINPKLDPATFRADIEAGYTVVEPLKH